VKEEEEVQHRMQASEEDGAKEDQEAQVQKVYREGRCPF